MRGPWTFDYAHYMILDLAAGGTWPDPTESTPFPSRMLVDHVRAYQKPSANRAPVRRGPYTTRLRTGPHPHHTPPTPMRK
ncbi:glycoside hydrolase family 16 protein [Streptomyces griseosporeus]|uniref:glycoside hydrolase family 16 protein n=1 Tax=Streptomyces griseosporeus TaxID=1910 RepID=UPI0036F6CFB1